MVICRPLALLLRLHSTLRLLPIWITQTVREPERRRGANIYYDRYYLQRYHESHEFGWTENRVLDNPEFTQYTEITSTINRVKIYCPLDMKRSETVSAKSWP
jgi:hypothetical protein